MGHERWQLVEEMFHATCDLSASEREAYFSKTILNDDLLRAEVETLLASYDAHRGFMERPAFSLGLRVIAENADEGALTGKRLGVYQILAPLGRGGMGEVYLAEDTRLGRRVALKFLSVQLVNDAWGRRHLTREAQSAAQLDHPNICAIYGIEDVEGHSFIVMQYIEGSTLADMIRARSLDIAEAVALSKQIVAAVVEAHAHGIIHCDIKPQNIMVSGGGQVKVLDFGLSKIVRRPSGGYSPGVDSIGASKEGLVAGTVAYMSPEQLRAERLDFRSDNFSLGIVLYELFTGNKPFGLASEADVISAILNIQPPPLKHHKSDIPFELDRIVFKCLEKDKEKRYQSASELLYDLSNIQQLGENATSSRRHFNGLMAASLVLLLFIGVLSAFAYRSMTRTYTLAVLPIANESADSGIEYFGDSLAESLITRFSRLSRLRVLPFTLVSGYKGTTRAPGEVGRELNVEVVFVGRIVREGDSLILIAQLFRAPDGARLWEERYKGVNTIAISDLQKDIASKITGSLSLRLRSKEERLLATHDTENEEALREYFRGRHWWRNRNKENIQKAVDNFDAAIALDPAFARAHAGLADCYALMNSPAYGDMPTEQAMGRARAEAAQALEIDDTLPEAHTSLGVVRLKYDWDWAQAENSLRRALALGPGYAPAHYWYSTLLTITGRQAEAVRESDLARKLDPLSPLTHMNFCRQYYFGRQYDKAIECFNEMLNKDSANVSARRVLGFVYLQKGMNDQAVEIFEKIPDTNKALKVVALGYSYARAGRKAEALRILAEVENMSHSAYIPPHELAVLYLGLNNKDRAFDWLNKACDERFATMIFFTVDPAFDTLRQDPRFGEIARRLHLPPSPPTA
jgi:serine/threonine-protein kinase